MIGHLPTLDCAYTIWRFLEERFLDYSLNNLEEILQPTDDAPEMGDMLLMQNIFANEILILYENYFNDV